MGEPNIFISNGTCYSAPGRRLDDSFIPCGNTAFGHFTCCGAGDNCLANNACWGVHGTGYGSSLTYLAGCTDPEYKDPSCPKKEFDQPWIALTHCDNSGGAWAPCSQPGSPSTLQNGAYCSCTDAAKTTIAFRDATVLSSIGSLPRATGESIQFFAGHLPTALSTPGTTGQAPGPGSGSTSGSGSATGSGSRGPGSSRTNSGGNSPPGETGSSPSGQDPTPSSSSGMGSGTKIAIAVGVTVGVLILLAAIIALFFLRRRGHHLHSGAASKNRFSDTSTLPKMPEAGGEPVLEADGKAARPWSMRSELEGSRAAGVGAVAGDGEKQKEKRDLTPVAELPG